MVYLAWKKFFFAKSKGVSGFISLNIKLLHAYVHKDFIQFCKISLCFDLYYHIDFLAKFFCKNV